MSIEDLIPDEKSGSYHFSRWLHQENASIRIQSSK